MITDPEPKKFSKAELSFVIAILALTLVLFIPSIINLFTKSEETTALANLGVLRSALSLYNSDNLQYPRDDLRCLLSNSRYLSSIPVAVSGSSHPPSHAVITETTPSDTGNWSYNNDPNNSGWGVIHIGCTHRDSKGVIWSTY